MTEKHYREGVRAAEGEAWFNIFRKKKRNKCDVVDDIGLLCLHVQGFISGSLNFVGNRLNAASGRGSGFRRRRSYAW